MPYQNRNGKEANIAQKKEVKTEEGMKERCCATSKFQLKNSKQSMKETEWCKRLHRFFILQDTQGKDQANMFSVFYQKKERKPWQRRVCHFKGKFSKRHSFNLMWIPLWTRVFLGSQSESNARPVFCQTHRACWGGAVKMHCLHCI